MTHSPALAPPMGSFWTAWGNKGRKIQEEGGKATSFTQVSGGREVVFLSNVCLKSRMSFSTYVNNASYALIVQQIKM